jgi:lipid-A-disaccharide synthase
MNLPAMLEAAALLGDDYEYLLPIAPTLDRVFLQNLIVGQRIILVPESLPALWHSRGGIVASGTATVEAAMMRTPFVMTYRVSRLTYLLGKPRVKVPCFAMVNLIAGEPIVPELVQQDFTAQNVVSHLRELLPDGAVRNRMLEGFTQVKTKLLAPGTFTASPSHPADRAAEIIMALLRLQKGPPQCLQ